MSGDSCEGAESGTVVSLLAERRGGGGYRLCQSNLLSSEELVQGKWVVFKNLESHCMPDTDSYRMKVIIKDRCAELNSSSFASEAFLIAVLGSRDNISQPKVNETDVRTTYSPLSKRSVTHFMPWEYCQLHPFNVRKAFKMLHLIIWFCENNFQFSCHNNFIQYMERMVSCYIATYLPRMSVF